MKRELSRKEKLSEIGRGTRPSRGSLGVELLSSTLKEVT